jgi:selenium metabolism protein YedF
VSENRPAAPPRLDPDLLLVLKSAGIGEGEPDLAERLMGSLLKMLLEGGTLPCRIVCMNAAVFLTTQGSPVLETLGEMARAGVEILSCSTCLEYYGRTDKLVIGSPTTMRETASALVTFKRVLLP